MISIVTASYNYAQYISETIESVLGQKFKDISLICIDDVSIDDSSKIIEEYSKNDSRVIYLKNDENSGPSATRNRGLDYVYENMPNVEYITFVDADDKIDENTFEKWYNEIDPKGIIIEPFDFAEHRTFLLYSHVKVRIAASTGLFFFYEIKEVKIWKQM